MKSRNKLTEEQIRPKKLKKINEDKNRIDLNFLLKRKNRFVKVSCPACQSKSYKNYLKKNHLSYLICIKCNTYYVSPRPSVKLLEEFYKQSKVYKFFNDYIFPKTEKIRSKKISMPRLKNIIKLSKKFQLKKPSLMEVGPGYGTFCNLAKKSKYFSSVEAVEPTPEGAENCRKKNIKVYQQPIEKLNTKKQYDIIVNFEVIEHLFWPKNFLVSMHKFLKKNGFIILTCPNGMGFDVQLLRDKSDTIDHEHLNYFNTSSIKKLFNKCGFKVIETFTPGQLDVDIVRNKVLEKKFSLKDYPFYEDIIINNYEVKGLEFQKFLTRNNLSSNMWVIAQKKS
ncbi:MAG: methyltransferase type 11 [Candidatus Marinimicrobia bacterium]|nr:methyltransferase type 11 [Candidatus Neomarinimicrobiota bacterium]